MSIITHPLIKKHKIGTDDWFSAQQEMIESKPMIRSCYSLWYSKLKQDAQSVAGKGLIIELGSGASHIQDIVPEVVKTDVVMGTVDLVVDAREMPFKDSSVKAIFLTHAFHHIPDVERFLGEAQRVLIPGGVISMVECAHTLLGRLFFSIVHPEPYRSNTESWEFDWHDNMEDSNQALSWLVFFRDKERFDKKFKKLMLEKWNYLPWFSYLLSGGVNLRSLVPVSAAPFFTKCDELFQSLDKFGAIHWHLTIRKNLH